MKRFIVELESGVWLAQVINGSSGRTFIEYEARKYSRWQDAKVGLTWAEKSGSYENARIVEVR